MKPFGLYAFQALELADAGARPPAAGNPPDAEPLSPAPSREEIAAAWRRWGERDGAATVTAAPGETPSGRGRGLSLPAPRTGI